jgi:hypothetical protein
MASITRYLPSVARVFMGLVFTVFGLNGFLNFIPAPPISGNALTFMSGLLASGYLLPLLKGTEVVTGLLLLSNRYVPLALTILAPIVINIVLFHTFVAPMNAVALLVLAAEVFLAWTYRASFRSVLEQRPVVSAPSSSKLPTLRAREAA